MKEFKKELKQLLSKYNAHIFVSQERDDSFLELQIHINGEYENIDSGYRDLIITDYSLKDEI